MLKFDYVMDKTERIKSMVSGTFMSDHLTTTVSHISVDRNGIIFAIILTNGYPVIAKLDKDLSVIDDSPIECNISCITGILSTSDGGAVCTAVIYNDDEDKSKNTFVMIKFDSDLDITYFRPYDMLSSSDTIVLMENTPNDIVCSGVLMRTSGGEVYSYLARVNEKLELNTCTRYDTTNSITITSLDSTTKNDIVAAGCIRLVDYESEEPVVVNESAMIITLGFKSYEESFQIIDNDVWIDSTDNFTRINDIKVLKDGSFICCGFTAVEQQLKATAWRFDNIGDDEPSTYMIDMEGENEICCSCRDYQADTVFSEIIIKKGGKIICVGELRNTNMCTALFMSEFNTKLKHYGDTVSDLFCSAEVARGTMLINDKVINVGNGNRCCKPASSAIPSCASIITRVAID